VPSSSTVDKIVAGAARALASRGVRRLSMSDICTEAGVSRGTLYRYFKSKDEVLEALAQHVLAGMATALDVAVAAQPALEDRLQVVLATMGRLADQMPYTHAVVEAEPGFALNFFRLSMPGFRAVLEPILEPALRTSPPVTSGLLSVGDLCELFERLMLSTYLVPTPTAHLLPVLLSDLWASLTAQHDRARHLAAAPGPAAVQPV
jgi:AcrR family transcriptional regulator